jgi:hypothetical protein
MATYSSTSLPASATVCKVSANSAGARQRGGGALRDRDRHVRGQRNEDAAEALVARGRVHQRFEFYQWKKMP